MEKVVTVGDDQFGQTSLIIAWEHSPLGGRGEGYLAIGPAGRLRARGYIVQEARIKVNGPASRVVLYKRRCIRSSLCLQ